jgi:hypothetical protein
MEVSWQVTGIRHDVAANSYRTVIEGAKPEAERGFYYHPEAFGLSQEQGMYNPQLEDAPLEESMLTEEMPVDQRADPAPDELLIPSQGIDEVQE